MMIEWSTRRVKRIACNRRREAKASEREEIDGRMKEVKEINARAERTEE